jgi:polysaccharide export outer membrane protein
MQTAMPAAMQAGRRAGAAGLLLLTALLLAACSLPRAAPVRSEVLAAAQAADPERAIQVVAVTRAALPLLAGWPAPPPPPGAPAPWPRAGAATGGPTAPVIAAGDLLSLQIWESDENPLLAGPQQRAVAIEGLAVSPQGSIFVPYVGEVTVAGLTPDAARAMLQAQIGGVLAAPQVLLGFTPGRQNSADLLGGVARPGSYPLTDRATTVLSLIAQGGGIAPGLVNPQVRLLRGGRVYGIAADRLLAEPARDLVLRGGDRVVVAPGEARFLALGAAGTQTEVAFPRDELSALEAVALIGGLEAGRANAQGVLILREYPEPLLRPAAAGAAIGPAPDRARVVFTLDLTSADGLFSAKRFAVRPGDVVLATESPVTAVRTVFGLLGQVLGISNRLEG